MKIEPLGVERDRQIAELRGDKGSPRWICDCNATMYNSDQVDWHGRFCDKTITPAIKAKPYSTDICAAMELWAGMREAGAQPSLAVVQDFVACDAWVNYGDDNADLISNLGDDETDKSTEVGAISECYVNWKVANNG